MNDSRDERVVTDRQRLAVATEQDLLMSDQPGEPDGVDADAVDVRAAGAVELLGRRVRRSLARPRRGDQLRGTAGGSARRVDLVRVVQLDDLDRVEVRRGRARRTASSGPRRSRSSVRSTTPSPSAPRSAMRGPRRAARRRSRSCRRRMCRPSLDAPAQVVHHGAGRREVDDDLGCRQRLAVLADIDSWRPARGRQRPRLRGIPRHPSGPCAPSTPTLVAHAANSVLVVVRADHGERRRVASSSSAATAWTSSRVTASIAASTSSTVISSP